MIAKLSLPLYYEQKFKTKPNKNILVALNWYRNCDFHINNKIKKEYHDIIKRELFGELGIYVPSKTGGKYRVKYKLYYKNSQSDLMNCVAVLDKYLQDALQEMGIVKNDNVKHYVGCSVEVAGQDKINPRLECEIWGDEKND
ncbi:MAG: hypothetical protein ACRCTS_01700 [Fusobacteriaceae bacterium]